MNKKILLGCLFAASVLTTTTSCSDFLDEDPKGQMSEANVFKSQADLDASIHTIYEKLNQTQSWTNPMYPQWQGDDMTANPSSNKQAVAALDVFSSDGENKGVTDAWSQHFALIKACNWVIENASKTPTSQEEINIALGNAHFWRAYAYFYMVRIFGPLPRVVTTDPSATNVAPSSVEEIYNLIVEDLKKAEGWLPTSYSQAPRNHDGVDAWVTKQATQATLTAVYMAMAGYPLNKGKEYYALAAAKAKEVIDNNGTYGFYNDPVWNHVYSMGHNYNKETILGIDNNWNSGSWDHDSQLTSCDRFEGLGDGGWGDAWGEIAFWKRYPEGPRKDAVYAPKITFQDGATITKVCNWWDLDAEGKPVVEAYHPMFAIYSVNCDGDNLAKEKFAPYNYLEPNYTNMTNGRRHRLIRYAEVLLWYAESAARSGGDLAKAKEYLREVRKRAVNDVENVTLSDGTKVAIANMTADQLAEACYIEHGWEVAGQWTQMVTRRADEFRMNELKKNFDYRVANKPVVVAVENGKEYTAKESVPVVKSTWAGDESIYCPYPTTEVEKNPNLKR
ncbi:RagB/SusD family nutrient uptake outer membrane protein [Leyella stercorea]|uniref:RagB/SusD family nutrient uptake outer membrane protein n=1 Tax=Leyella stercorea TaxID=363265 RepID=UPI001C2C5ED6|nr:RagB/SusD family nutrient uptake outer membrane protein [Leyella stercorea]MBU9947626.1 RagB/SusD family nutrient uptake outer membrane protein [Leyella stercorea]